ncbi:LOW QUALITY PROTEIN: alpha-2,8-sialyltransferase 8F [Choloepus didactylus]|uniref:LOW QUALITY PROTEIN: alpha-2,8-sialyltransferase 8F n=1 Tax=Choloepus didactylus TaxID=27675 RepID=UPI00189FD952|nr:LOW QUALITY PROTEIN: alpha-2,8-sialyltransferase 8F [Choloepus didactylus]
MRPGGALLALLASLLLLLLLRLLGRSADAPARARLVVEGSRAATPRSPAALRTPRSPASPRPRATNSTYLKEKSPQLTEKCKQLQDGFESLSEKMKWYSEADYLQMITTIQNCPWKRRAEEYENFRAQLASCCGAVQNSVVSQNNTPVGTNLSYEVERRKGIQIGESIFGMLPVAQPFGDRPLGRCAVVGNGGILNKSLCGAEIDQSDFVFRCNLPPTTGNVSKDVGSKTNLVTVNPSIISLRYGNLEEKRAAFLEDIATYGDTFLLLPAFSFRANTGTSFKVFHTLRSSNARQQVLFFHPAYLRRLALFWRTRGVVAYRLSSGLMVASVAVELCEHVRVYGFWPFSKTVGNAPVSHHYYDNQPPKRGFHAMPQEFLQILQLHVKGILRVQFSKCGVARTGSRDGGNVNTGRL